MRSISLTFIVLFNCIKLLSQNYSISGFVEDAKTGERLIGAVIYDSISQNGNNTNSYGYFNIQCHKGPINIICSYIGYKNYRIAFSLENDTTVNVLLQPDTYSLKEVVIEDKKRLFESSRMSTTIMPMSTIKQIPMLLGEIDILKSLQSLPGVQAGTEGTSGLYIRGGGPDQNLILLDGVPVYNPDHLFGFVSVFNSDAIKSVSLITGGFPAQYGGRLSSVVDIRMKEGNNKEFHCEGTMGLISSKITLEGPLKKNKTSYLISARRSWLDLFTRTILKSREMPYYYFYDLTAKINHIFSNRSRLFLSIYSGKDHISSINTTSTFMNGSTKNIIKQNMYYGWGNLTAALRWNYIFNNRLFSNTSISFSNYDYFDNKLINTTRLNQSTGVSENDIYKSSFSSGIKDIASKIDFDYQPFTGHNIKFGIGGIYHIFTPYANISLINSGNDSTQSETDRFKQIAFEPSAYIEDEITLGSRLKIDAGLRLTAFIVRNKKYSSIEPRLSGRYLFTDKWALKFAYSRMKQYIHLLTSSRITFPTDLWVPTTDKVNPQLSDQIALGSVYNYSDNFEFSIETYFKSMKELIEYSEGSSFLETGTWESKIEKGGIGRAYGLEFMLKKSAGNTTGWISYTLSKTERKFNNINAGNWFPYKYDRRHDVNIMINHRFNDKIDAGLTWTYTSGCLFTLITGVYDSYLIYGDNRNIQYFENRNNYRSPSYHRLDLGLNFHKQKKSYYRTWSISVYNAYNRKNVFFIYPANTIDNGKQNLLAYKKYTLFPILPSVTYSLKF
jgi:hypothetical protein